MSLIILATPDVKIEQSLIESTLGSDKVFENGDVISGKVVALNEGAEAHLKGELWVFNDRSVSQWEKVRF